MTPTQRYRIMLALQNIQRAFEEGTTFNCNHDMIKARGNVFINEIIDVINHVAIIEDKTKRKN